jgi:phosphoribosylamine--glycine ligase
VLLSAQVVLPRLDEDLLSLMSAATQGALPNRRLKVLEDAAVDVVLAAPGYPESPETGAPISGLTEAEAAGEGVRIFHAGTRFDADGIVTAGGRVLNVVGIGDDIATARAAAYSVADNIDFTGKQVRSDIGEQW